MRKVFISSVVGGFEEYRSAARRAVELMGDRPIMCEDFGARPHSSEKACITEVETSDVYVVLLGDRYGFKTPEEISVTQAEFRAAQNVGKPILVFVQKTEMDPEQQRFRQEVENYKLGLFRAEFASPEELKDEIVKGLRQLKQVLEAAPEEEFVQRTKECFRQAARYLSTDHPELNFTFWPQPTRHFDIVQLEKGLDQSFGKLCAGGLATMRDGYRPIMEKQFTGLESGSTKILYFHNGFLLLSFRPTVEREGFFFSSHFAPPSRLQEVARGVAQLLDFNGAWCGIQLRGMAEVYVKELPPPGTNSITMKGIWGGDDEAHFHERLIPVTEASYLSWGEACINRFRRIFAK